MATAELAPTAPPTQALDLTPEQKQQLLDATAELIRATVTARPPVFPDPMLAGAATKAVSGAFVSLKRGKHLRSCCGGLQNQPTTLGKAVYEATLRTVLEDTRFPPLSPTELEHLEMEIWLLFNPQPVWARGDERVRAVIIGGKHGLVVERGPSRGLLLPGVAVEHDWDSRRFLEQVCVKAGLHPSLWKDDATTLLTFEGEALRGRVGGANGGTRPKAMLQPQELAAYVEFCRGNILALLEGLTPNFYAFHVPDGTVNGAVLSLRVRAGAETLHLSHISLRPGVPLQSTLYSLSQGAAQALANQGAALAELDGLELGITVLYDPALHGTVGDPHLDGIQAPDRAVLVLERAKAGLVFHPEQAPEDLLSGAARQAQVHRPAGAAVFSLEALTTELAVSLSTAPKPVAGPAVRPAALAGQFYPADPGKLFHLVDNLLAGERAEESWPAAMVPHAGLRFSGPIAAAVLRRIRIPRTVIVLGPKHTPLGMEWAVAPHQTWALPGATVASDPDLARRLADAIPGLALDAAAHQQEHGVEVELPFLARLAPEAKVVGIAIGHGDLDDCRQIAVGLASVLRECDEPPLLLISSDMNHFATDAENRRLDELALAALERLDPEEVYETVTGNHISMCGVLPAVIVLDTLRRLGGLQKAERVGYATSADVTGDTSRVVGYAGMLFG